MNNNLAKRIQASKYFQAIKKADKAFTKFLDTASEETKSEYFANVEKQNTRGYQVQKMHVAVIDDVIGDMLNDPQWRADLENYLKTKGQ